ncbi:MAG: hypothetical protein ACRBFS_06390 [Aureispira sp.]
MKFLFLSTHFTETLIEKTQLYCIAHGIEVVRINLEDLLPNTINTVQVTIAEDDISFRLKGETHLLSEFSLIWKRRISDNFISTGRLFENYKNVLPKPICEKLLKEVYDLRDLILLFSKKLNLPIINDYDLACRNKPFQIIKANEFGLKSPSMLLSNSMVDLNSFISTCSATITKPIGGLGYLSDEKEIMSIKTTSVNLNYVKDVSAELIFPSFLQERIQSKYELKCTLVGEELFCVKQYYEGGNIPTTDIKLAYRNKQITNIEYELKPEVKGKIIKLCKYFKLDLCTMDIIKNVDGDYVFLEINPDGVVEYYSYFLSFPIYEKIFEMLQRNCK